MESEIAAAPTSRSTIELPNWRATSASRDGAGSVRSWLGPAASSRLAASASLRPLRSSTPSSAQTSAAGRACASSTVGGASAVDAAIDGPYDWLVAAWESRGSSTSR